MRKDLYNLKNKVFKIGIIGQVRDIFLLSYYAGLANADLIKLSRQENFKKIKNDF